MAAAERDVEAATPTTGAAIRPERSDRQSVVAPQNLPTAQLKIAMLVRKSI
jgi:hypothetical protein